MPRPYGFHGEYRLAAPSEPVLAALRDADHWPDWWPQIRAVVRHTGTTGLVTVRSLLPVTLHLALTVEVDDVTAGVLRAGIGQDLQGWIEFRVAPGAGERSAVVSYRQECVLTKPVLARSGRLLRPVLGLNHTAMMRSGMRALESYARH